MTEAWAYIAHKDGQLGGIIAGDAGKKNLSKFLGDFAVKGFAIHTVADRKEYLAFIEGKDFYGRTPQESASE